MFYNSHDSLSSIALIISRLKPLGTSYACILFHMSKHIQEKKIVSVVVFSISNKCLSFQKPFIVDFDEEK